MLMIPYSQHCNQELYLSDALSALQELPTGYVQSIIAGPPYFEPASSGAGTWEGGSPSCDHKMPSRTLCSKCGANRSLNDAARTSSQEEYIANIAAILDEARRVLREDGTLWLVSGDCYSNGLGIAAKNLYGTPWKLAQEIKNRGWFLRSDVIWERPNIVKITVADRPVRSHDYVFLFSKSPKYYYNALVGTAEGRRLHSVWQFATESYKSHGFDYGIFPRGLVARCMQLTTRTNDIVLNPFCGTATVGVVAMQLGRRSIGIELNSKYIAIADERLRETQQALEAHSVKIQ